MACWRNGLPRLAEMWWAGTGGDSAHSYRYFCAFIAHTGLSAIQQGAGPVHWGEEPSALMMHSGAAFPRNQRSIRSIPTIRVCFKPLPERRFRPIFQDVGSLGKLGSRIHRFLWPGTRRGARRPDLESRATGEIRLRRSLNVEGAVRCLKAIGVGDALTLIEHQSALPGLPFVVREPSRECGLHASRWSCRV